MIAHFLLLTALAAAAPARAAGPDGFAGAFPEPSRAEALSQGAEESAFGAAGFAAERALVQHLSKRELKEIARDFALEELRNDDPRAGGLLLEKAVIDEVQEAYLPHRFESHQPGDLIPGTHDTYGSYGQKIHDFHERHDAELGELKRRIQARADSILTDFENHGTLPASILSELRHSRLGVKLLFAAPFAGAVLFVADGARRIMGAAVATEPGYKPEILDNGAVAKLLTSLTTDDRAACTLP